MSDRSYYSLRTGNNPLSKFDLPILLRIFKDIFLGLEKKGYFQESFGFYCVDEGQVAGSLGVDIDAQIFRRIRKNGLYPISEKVIEYTEEDLFDVIEFLYDVVSEPMEGRLHSYNNCGMHYWSFNKFDGQKEYRSEINSILKDYSKGFELSNNGEILTIEQNGLQDLLDMKVPTYDPNNVDEKVKSAVHKYRSRHSTIDDQKDAIRDLADVLEYLRKEIEQLIKNGLLVNNDEKDLFELANKFGIRHHDGRQNISYDKEIWYPWMFFYYLSTIHAMIQLIKKTKT